MPSTHRAEEEHETIRKTSTQSVPERRFRLDIQGLRAIAVTLVVTYHLLPDTFTGGYIGVDVFFVISGFLITNHLLSKPPTTPRLLADFWARRVRRLLPAAFAVIVATLCLTWLVAPESRWRSVSWDGIASAFYMQNWRLAASSTDYLAAEEAPSPLQHYWSLSIEEQFYIFWPILILVVLAVAVRMRWNSRVAVTVALAVITGVSFGYGLYLTTSEPSAAYFVSTTRIWELGVGALLACLHQLWQPGRLMGIIYAWAGLLLILWASITYTPATPFPGAAALAPTLGAALFMWPASSSRWSPTGFLGIKPIQWVGDASYSIYLWHWPLIAIVPWVGNGRLGWIDSVVIIVATLGLSALSKNFIEDRFRQARMLRLPSRSFAMGASSMVLVAALAVVPVVYVGQQERATEHEVASAKAGTDPCLGARALDKPIQDCPIVARDQLIPEPAVAGDDKANAYADDCWEESPFPGLTKCVYGQGSRNIALVGNSHAGQWLPALQKIAADRDFRITTFLASSCAPLDADLELGEKAQSGCRAWGQRMLKATSGGKFDLVIVSARNVHGVAGSSEASFQLDLEAGYSGLLQSWQKQKTNVLVLHDTPFPQDTIKSIPDCLADDDRTVEECSGDAAAWIPEDPLYAAAKKGGSTIHTADLNAHICRPERCYGANGGVVTYFDGSHLSATYSATLSPYLEPKILASLKEHGN
ncbi:acyltransferase family protein [Arthrobacter rhombi]|uniref:acyltransferase family protein n=1 Tax=Arthrobacter rhombi TaxID=71253 RepID=UPI003FD2A677